MMDVEVKTSKFEGIRLKSRSDQVLTITEL